MFLRNHSLFVISRIVPFVHLYNTLPPLRIEDILHECDTKGLCTWLTTSSRMTGPVE